MALTTGTQAASATPATDQYNLLATALTAAGWTHVHGASVAAATMGTTDIVHVWADPAAVLAADVYTGIIIYIEVDDTNLRLRVRISEKYDSVAAGAPALRVKWAAPGHQGGPITATPTANYAVTDSFIALFQAAAAASTVGWVNMPCSASGFNYWLGVNSTKLVYFNNSGGLLNSVVCGKIEFLGTAGGDTCVFLYGGYTGSNTITNASWTISNSTSATGGTVRVSRDPLNTASANVPFVAAISGPMPSKIGVSSAGRPDSWSASTSIDQVWFTGAHFVLPAFLHGTASSNGASSSPGYRQGACFLSSLSEFGVIPATASSSITASPNQGDEVVVGGATYTVVGMAMWNSGIEHNMALVVLGSSF